MPYNNIISRSDINALIPEEVSSIMLDNIQNQSAALTLFQRTQMSTNQTRMPVMSALPTAYFVNGDTGLKQTTEMAWANKYFNVEEIAAIVPIPIAVLDDSSFDVWGEVRPKLEDAVARTLDAAVFFGVDKPSSWPDDIITAATAASHTAVIGTSTVAEGGIAEDINQLFSLVENDGFDVNGVAASPIMRGSVRALRDSNGNRIDDVTPTEWWSVGNVIYPMRGLWPTAVSTARAVVGDFTKAILAVRQDFTYTILDQAVITDSEGAIIYNLPQQDMIAMRIVARYAYQVSNPIRYDNLTEATRFPFAVLLAAAT